MFEVLEAYSDPTRTDRELSSGWAQRIDAFIAAALQARDEFLGTQRVARSDPKGS